MVEEASEPLELDGRQAFEYLYAKTVGLRRQRGGLEDRGDGRICSIDVGEAELMRTDLLVRHRATEKGSQF